MSKNTPNSRPNPDPRVNVPTAPVQRPLANSNITPASSKQQTSKPAAGASATQSVKAKPVLVKPAPKAKPRRARLLVSKVDPWSVLKMSFLLSVALGIVTVVAAIIIWTVLDLTGVFDQISKLVTQFQGPEIAAFDIKQFASLGQVAAITTSLAVVNVILLTALSMLSAVLYNVSASLVGGIGVTLTDD